MQSARTMASTPQPAATYMRGLSIFIHCVRRGTQSEEQPHEQPRFVHPTHGQQTFFP